MAAVDFGPIARSFYERVRAFYAERGHSLDEPAVARSLDTNSALIERRAEVIRRLLRRECDVSSVRGARIVDVGCGFGVLGARFAAEGASVVGIDLATERLEVGRIVAREYDLDLTLSPARMEELDGFAHTDFDIAILNNSFCYVVDPAARSSTLGGILHALRPGGWLVIRDPNGWSPVDPFTGLPGVSMLPAGIAGRVVRLLGRARSEVVLISPPAARRELRQAGFSPVRVSYLEGPLSWRPVGYLARYHHVVGRRPLA